jgi:putative ABC transport system permease protein
VPLGQLAAITLVAAMAGVVAAILPARRASRLNVLAAIATE